MFHYTRDKLSRLCIAAHTKLFHAKRANLNQEDGYVSFNRVVKTLLIHTTNNNLHILWLYTRKNMLKNYVQTLFTNSSINLISVSFDKSCNRFFLPHIFLIFYIKYFYD